MIPLTLILLSPTIKLQTALKHHPKICRSVVALKAKIKEAKPNVRQMKPIKIFILQKYYKNFK